MAFCAELPINPRVSTNGIRAPIHRRSVPGFDPPRLVLAPRMAHQAHHAHRLGGISSWFRHQGYSWVGIPAPRAIRQGVGRGVCSTTDGFPAGFTNVRHSGPPGHTARGREGGMFDNRRFFRWFYECTPFRPPGPYGKGQGGGHVRQQTVFPPVLNMHAIPAPRAIRQGAVIVTWCVTACFYVALSRLRHSGPPGHTARGSDNCVVRNSRICGRFLLCRIPAPRAIRQGVGKSACFIKDCFLSDRINRRHSGPPGHTARGRI